MNKRFENKLYDLCEEHFGNDFEFNWTEEEGEGNASGFRCILDVWGQRDMSYYTIDRFKRVRPVMRSG